MTQDSKVRESISPEKTNDLPPKARLVLQVTVLVAVFTLGVIVGTKYHTLVDHLLQRGTDERVEAAVSPSTTGTQSEPPKDGTPAIENLLIQLDIHLRRLLAERDPIESAAKEDRIAYNLLRTRGYSDDSVECQRLVNRQKQLDARLAQIDEMIVEAKRFQRQLHDVVDAAKASHSVEKLPDQLVAEIRRSLAHSNFAASIEIEIPDERWEGGPDLLMKSNQSEDDTPGGHERR